MKNIRQLSTFFLFFVSFFLQSLDQPHSHLTVICGSMASGKSDEFIRVMRRKKVANPDDVIIFKHKIDNRILNSNQQDPSRTISSRSGSSIECITVPNTDEMESYFVQGNYSIIGIDEAQFFNAQELLTFVQKMLALKKQVIIAGLDLDFKSETFSAMGDLLALADDVTKLKAICSCCKQDRFCITQRMIDGKPAHYHDPLVMVGASEYEARCRDCHQVIMTKRTEQPSESATE